LRVAVLDPDAAPRRGGVRRRDEHLRRAFDSDGDVRNSVRVRPHPRLAPAVVVDALWRTIDRDGQQWVAPQHVLAELRVHGVGIALEHDHLRPALCAPAARWVTLCARVQDHRSPERDECGERTGGREGRVCGNG